MITKVHDQYFEESDFPLLIELNFSKLIELWNEKANEGDPHAKATMAYLEKNYDLDRLRQGFTDAQSIARNMDAIDGLMRTIFPYPLTDNEIKSATIPFTNLLFHKSRRLDKLLRAAGPDFELKTRNLDHNNAYIMACSLVLMFHYGYNIDFRRPFLYDIPDAKGELKNYRVMLNGDFMEVMATEKAVPITKEDVSELIDNFDNIDLWKEKFPPHSYKFKGFGLANIFDVTIDEALADIKTNLVNRLDQSFHSIEQNFRKLFGIPDLDLGLTLYDNSAKTFKSMPHPDVRSLLLDDLPESVCSAAFDMDRLQTIITDRKVIAISDVEKCKGASNCNQFYDKLNSQGYQSYMAAPLLEGNRVIAVIELGSRFPQVLHSINSSKLDDVVPILSVMMSQLIEEHRNMLEVIIQEECTSIHPAVSWKFEEEAERFFRARLQNQSAVFQEIVFEDVYPLYGQCDIRGSSDARNLSICKDLHSQLEAAEHILKMAFQHEALPAYNKLIYSINQFKEVLQATLDAGTDQQILTFLKTDVHPVFHFLLHKNVPYANLISNYYGMLDENYSMVYDARKDYDDTVAKINKELSKYLDVKAEEAQLMFPHFFERYKTDGVEFNIYIGQSLVKDRQFSKVYLDSLKLWQLTTMCEMERLFNTIKADLKTPLEVASLILAYATPLSIRFRMDEKKFDVDGAYNARYEIVKKRIDKSYIKGTSERLTQPGKLSIIYSNQSERLEYDKYAAYLKAMNLIKGEIEYHVLEDLQGITGLGAMRLSINLEKEESESDNDRVLKNMKLRV